MIISAASLCRPCSLSPACPNFFVVVSLLLLPSLFLSFLSPSLPLTDFFFSLLIMKYPLLGLPDLVPRCFASRDGASQLFPVAPA